MSTFIVWHHLNITKLIKINTQHYAIIGLLCNIFTASYLIYPEGGGI